MPLYELLVINTHIKRFVRRALHMHLFLLLNKTSSLSSFRRQQEHVRDLVKTTALNVMNQGGVVRSLKFWGTRNLPQRMRSHKQWWTGGECVTFLLFDDSASQIDLS
jgi:ribosomal protein S6